MANKMFMRKKKEAEGRVLFTKKTWKIMVPK